VKGGAGTPAHIAVDRLAIRHLGRRRRCLDGVSLAVAPGERLLVVGPSGAGKSTLALCLNGLVPHSIDVHWEAGDVWVGDVPTAGASPGDLTRRVGYCFQDPDAQVVLGQVDDDIAFGLENRGVPRAEMPGRIHEARAAVGLEGVLVPREVHRLSGGTRQRLALAGLVVARPDILVLDEPVANVDPEGAAQVWATVERLVEGRHRSLVVIEHAPDDVLHLVDRVAVLDDAGRVACTGTPDEVFVGHLDVVRALGVRLPAWAVVAAIAGSPRMPRSPDEAARMLAGARLPPSRTGAGEGQGVGALAPERPELRVPRTTPRVSMRGVGFRYLGATRDAVSGVDLDLHAGELVAVVGGNGAGKSTLGLIMAGAQSPTAGVLSLDGRAVDSVPLAERRRWLRYVFQYPEHQFVGNTVRADLEAAVKVERLPASEGASRVAAAMKSAALDHLADANPFTLSHGQKRRLSVASALITDPDVVVLDEPTFGQDDRHGGRLMRRVAERVASGATAVVVTHDLDLVAEYATRVVALADGRVVFDGHPAELLADDAVLAACALRRPPVAEVVARAVALRLQVPDLACRHHLERILDRMVPGGVGARGTGLTPLPPGTGLTPQPLARRGKGGSGRSAPPTMGREASTKSPGMGMPPPSWLARRNPTVKFATVIVLGLAMTFITDPVTPMVWWLVALGVAATAGVTPRRLLPALVPVAAFAFGLFMTNAFLAARPTGEVVVAGAGPFRLTWHGIWLGIALALRGLATATVGLTFIMTTDPTDLVISLIHHGRLPYRWGYAVLAGYRFLPGLAEELAQVRLARRVRGEDVADGWLARLGAPVRELRILLTVAILRASRLAIAMDARGFADVRERTYYRVVGLTGADAVLAAGAVATLGAVVATTWRLGVLRGALG
jgi:energy-coupling factor transport system ATP-binding protein